MSSVVSATSESDACESENIQYGENNHIEYKWSTIQQENILQLSYQLVRTSNTDNMAASGRRFGQCFEKGTVHEKRLLLRMLAHTRDVECGKGEHALSLVMLKELMSIDMDLSVRALNCLKAADVETLGDLVSIAKSDLLKFRNFGKKSLTELEDLVDNKNLVFGMNVAKYKLDKD